jgi:hypothetical protein
MAMHHRDLTPGEAKILGIFQDGYGSKNTVNEVFFTLEGEAAMAVRNSAGDTHLVVNLTNLAAWRADGSIATDDALRKDWLRLRWRTCPVEPARVSGRTKRKFKCPTVNSLYRGR